MSYDLFMKPKNEDVPIQRFQSYFAERDNYLVEGSQVSYQNKDTGVYFFFEYQDKQEGEEEYFPLAFNMNYFRPTFFVQEAEPEVKELISSFDLTVDDPQSNGMGTGEYSSEKFISGWSHGNEFGYRSILKSNPEVNTLPTQALEEAWAWNRNKENLQMSVTEDVFVPSIMLFKYQGEVITACVWPDAIPSILPPVDILLIGRKELATRRLLKKVEDMAIGVWSDIQPLLDTHKTKMHGNAYYLSYPSVPSEIKKVVQGLTSINLEDIQRLPADQVLNRELVQKYMD